MRLLHTTNLILMSLFILSSCAYKQNQILFEKKRSSVTDSVIAKRNLANLVQYRIQPQDILQIRNLYNSKALVDMEPAGLSPANSSSGSGASQGETFQVETDGTIPLTGLGRVQIAGLTRIEAAKKIEALYKDTILKQPLIEVKITNLKVTVMGEVKAPGNYPLTKDATTLIDILGAAGGLTEKANEKDVEIIRGKNGPTPTSFHLDLSNARIVTDTRAILQNDDVIYVKQNDRAVRTDALQSFTSIIQPVLIVVSAMILVLSIAKK